MASTTLVTFGSTTGVKAANTTNAPGTLVDRDPTDSSINVGPVNTNAIVNTGTDTVSIGASTAAAGTTTTDAGVLPAGTAKVYLTSAADGTKGVRVSASDQVTGREIRITNPVAAVLKIYPPSGGTINALSADAAFSTASGKGATLVCTSGGSNTWAAFG